MEISVSAVIFSLSPLLVFGLIALWIWLSKPNDKDNEIMKSVSYIDISDKYPSTWIRCLSEGLKREFAYEVFALGALASFVFSVFTQKKVLVIIFAILLVIIAIVIPMALFIRKFAKNEIARRK